MTEIYRVSPVQGEGDGKEVAAMSPSLESQLRQRKIREDA